MQYLVYTNMSNFLSVYINQYEFMSFFDSVFVTCFCECFFSLA